MASKERADFKIVVSEAEFEIANFAFASAYAGKRNADIAEIVSGPLLRLNGHSFCIVVDWPVKQETPNLGISVIRQGKETPTLKFSLEMSVLNKTAALNKRFGNSQEVLETTFGASILYGWGSECGKKLGTCIPLKAILDSSKGWLHNGDLRVTAKMSMAAEQKTLNLGLQQEHLQRNLVSSLGELLKSEADTDLKIIVSGETLAVHSLILKSRSSVFRSMLCVDMVERSRNEIIIDDLEPRAMRELVRFFYVGSVQSEVLEDIDHTMALLKAAHKYDATDVVEVCVDALIEKLTTESVIGVLDVSNFLRLERLTDACFDFIRLNATDVLQSDSYCELVSKGPSGVDQLVRALVGGPPSKRQRQTK